MKSVVQVDDQLEKFAAWHQLFPWLTGKTALAHRLLDRLSSVLAMGSSVAPNLATDRRRRRGASVEHSGNGALAHAAHRSAFRRFVFGNTW